MGQYPLKIMRSKSAGPVSAFKAGSSLYLVLAPKETIKRRGWGIRCKYIGGQAHQSLERMGSHKKEGGTGG